MGYPPVFTNTFNGCVEVSERVFRALSEAQQVAQDMLTEMVPRQRNGVGHPFFGGGNFLERWWIYMNL